ncbi:uncharacterized protein LOC106136115 [Amyelois transitella]|uniref:uncharacterized protein LOC106136115 n=1 Tax=Amyelois transitella TaxID=680683 RepID=UPI00067DF44C|nr:uncharacterized protein LOC106136115 [Amyelois transitella]
MEMLSESKDSAVNASTPVMAESSRENGSENPVRDSSETCNPSIAQSVPTHDHNIAPNNNKQRELCTSDLVQSSSEVNVVSSNKKVMEHEELNSEHTTKGPDENELNNEAKTTNTIVPPDTNKVQANSLVDQNIVTTQNTQLNDNQNEMETDQIEPAESATVETKCLNKNNVEKVPSNIETSIPNDHENSNLMSNNELLIEQNGKSMDPIDPARLEIDTFHYPKVNLYAEDTGPKLYDVTDNFVSKPIIPSKLPEAFSSLPVFARPKNNTDLLEFQNDQIKGFVGSGWDEAEFERLAAYCSPDNLRTGRELTMLTNSPGQGFYPSEMEKISKNTEDFTTSHERSIVRKLKLRVEKDTKNLYSKRYKYRGIRMISLGNDVEDNTPVVTLGEPLTPGKELLFFIRWYRPFSYNPKDKSQYRTRHSVFSCNIVMLGRHRLTLLRDRVVCPNDVDMRLDVSARPDEIPCSSAKEMFPSGFLFINNVFYVDSRAGCRDYTEPIRRWAKSRGLGDFPVKDASQVRLDQLTVKLGHPEVYVHQGNCEHLFTISEIRLLNTSDPLKFGSYPCHTALSQNQTIYCTTCAEFGAKWIVVGCSRVPFDPAFFCEKCFKLYLYKDGKKIGNFKAYLYRGNEINVLKPQG